MKILAIDYGEKRVGLALSDPDGKLAFPLKTVYKSGKQELFAELLHIVENEQVGMVVVGLPLPLDKTGGAADAPGREPLILRQVRNFKNGLEHRLKERDPVVRVLFHEEGLSSREAESRLRELGVRGGKLKGALDMQAAVVILEGFIASGDPQGGQRIEHA